MRPLIQAPVPEKKKKWDLNILLGTQLYARGALIIELLHPKMDKGFRGSTNCDHLTSQ
jgi:hypothetical protein